MDADVQALHVHSISGVNFVATEFQLTGTPTVASLSLGGGVSDALDNALVQVSHQRIPSCSSVTIPRSSSSSLTPALPLSSLRETITRMLSTTRPLVSNKPLPLLLPPLPTPRLLSQTSVRALMSGPLASTSFLLTTTDRSRPFPELRWPPHMFLVSSLISSVSTAL